MQRIHFQLIVFMLVMLIMFKDRIDKYLVKAGDTWIWACYTYTRIANTE